MTPVQVSSLKNSIDTECPICDFANLRWKFEKKDRQFWECKTCGLIFQNPLPTPAELHDYYDNEYANGMYSIFTSVEEMKILTAKRRLKKISRWVPMEGRWLDVGCANGVFINEAATKGIVASGVELSQIAVDQAMTKGLNVICGSLNDIPDNPSFDVITGFDVLEHVLDPHALMEGIAKRLKPGGYAFLTLPNVSSLYSILMKKRWWFYIPEEHIYYFNPRTLTKLAVQVGLHVKHIGRTSKPLTFNYGLTQFIEYNPLIYRAMKLLEAAIPNQIREWIIPCYIGEMEAVMKKYH